MEATTFIKLIEAGVTPIVEFTRNINDWDGFYDPKMRAVATGIKKCPSDDVVEVLFDFTMFEDYNRQFEEHTYWDEFSHPTLSAREAGCFPKDCKESVYIGNELGCETPFDVVIDLRPTQFKATHGEYDYIIQAVGDFWIVNRKKDGHALWDHATQDDWQCSVAQDAEPPMKFNDLSAATNFVYAVAVNLQ